jgi:hypothetical protein
MADDNEQQPNWPLSVEEAVDQLVEALSDEDQAAIRAMGEGQMQAELHFSLGMYIRNQFGLWRGNEPLLADCASHLSPGADARFIHPDGASGVILAALWRRLREGA